MTRITQVQWYPYQVPLRNGFMTAHGMLHIRQGAIIELTTASGITGLGEIAPLPEFRGNNLPTALNALPGIITRLLGQPLTVALKQLYENAVSLPSSTIYALETALLDALGQSHHCPISTLLAPQARTQVLINTVIGAQTTAATVQRACQAVAEGFFCLKLKVGNDPISDLERISAVRTAVGPTINLRLDANEAWTLKEAQTIINKLARFNIQYIEQPLKASDLIGMQLLRQSVPIPIAADEAVYDLESAQHILSAQAADILILKPQLIGGLHASQQIIQAATSQGVQCVITSAIETGVGLIAALHLVAASPAITMECGLATLHLLENDLVLEDLSIHRGFLTLPSAPGLGIHLDRTALATYMTPPTSPIINNRTGGSQ